MEITGKVGGVLQGINIHSGEDVGCCIDMSWQMLNVGGELGNEVQIPSLSVCWDEQGERMRRACGQYTHRSHEMLEVFNGKVNSQQHTVESAVSHLGRFEFPREVGDGAPGVT